MSSTEKLNIDWGDDKVQRNQRLVEKNPYDLEAWTVLLREAQTRHISDMRQLYERVLEIFPNAARYWKIYLEHEIRVKNYEKAEKLFQRCLIKILNIDLWKLYVNYVKETKANSPAFKEKMAQAYDFALDRIGMDIHSYTIWNDYANFLKSVEAIGSFAENQKISAIRKVYQRGIVNPMLNIEQFWKDYLAFEQTISAGSAEKMSRDRSKDHMNAKRVSKELEMQIRGINRNLPNVPPTGTCEELRQIDLWRKYVMWEKSNPLQTDDMAQVVRRTLFAYEQCLLCLGHHPDIWYQATLFLQQSSKQLLDKGDSTSSKIFGDEAASIFERAITTLLKKNMLIYFAYADYEESRSKYDKVHQVYQKFLEKPDIDPTLCYIQYMKFARRVEGIKSARNVFKLAREDSRSHYHVYVAAALMEYYCGKDKNVAFRIFELGLKKYAANAKYILAYVDYLQTLNDDNNTRVLFERVLSAGSLDADSSLPIWDRFLEFESNVGDLMNIMKVEKRRADAIEKIRNYEGNEAAYLVDRYRFMNLYPCSAVELKTIGYNDIVLSTMQYRPGPSLYYCFGQQLKSSNETNGFATNSHVQEENNWSARLPRPDTNQMIPYKPKPLNMETIGASVSGCAASGQIPSAANGHIANSILGPHVEHSVPGGVFPMPSSLAQLCTRLPPPFSFQGPFVSRELLADFFNRILLPDKCPEPVEIENGAGTGTGTGDRTRLFDLARSVNWIQTDKVPAMTTTPTPTSTPQTTASKRKHKNTSDQTSAGATASYSDDDEHGHSGPPPVDIYRARQQKKSRFS